MTIQMVAGSLFQPTRCPLVVAMLGNWVCNKEVTYNGYLACSHIYWKPYGVHIRIYGWGRSMIVAHILIDFSNMIVFIFLPVLFVIILGNKDAVLSPGKRRRGIE